MTKTYQSKLFEFAYFPSYEDQIKELAESIADPEVWDFSDAKKCIYSILKAYLEHTFRKIQAEKKIYFTTNNKFAAFNTGLVTPNLEEIIAYFEAYKCPRVHLDRFPPHLQAATPNEVRRQLFGAIDEVKKKVKTNYKIAIPQYYEGKIQLLLPFCLTAGSSNPDLALVVHSLNDTTYTARTCLTLKMAYSNARLIVKPQSSWLKP